MNASTAGPPDRRSRRGARAEQLQRDLEASLSPEFDIIGRLGGGSSSTVFLAREPALQRLVAIKALHPDEVAAPKTVARFRREATALAAISHPNVVSIYRVGEIGDSMPYLVMQYVRGRDLRERLKRDGPLPETEAIRVLHSITSALQTVHSHGLAHRDVRPQSILCEDASDRVLLADFGLVANLADDDGETDRLTTAGHIVTDFRFSSPEVLQGAEPSAASDIYSLGVLAYHLLAGFGPYPGSGLQGQVRAHLTLDPLPLASLGVQVSSDLQELLEGCLAKDPADRPSTAEVLGRLARRRSADDRAESPSEPERVSSIRTPGETGQRPRYSLKVLGALDLTSNGECVDSVLKQPKRLALLAFLALGVDRGYRRRDSLIDAFWPSSDPASARHSLRQALYVLRRDLEADVILTRGDEEVGLDPAVLQCDAVLFRQHLNEGRGRQAMELYRGDLMPGFYLDGAPGFERWLDTERLALRREAATGARNLSDAAYSEGESREAIRWARTAVDLDPFDESSLYRLICLLRDAGDRAGALSAYSHFALRLEREYAAEPSARTRDLIEVMRTDAS